MMLQIGNFTIIFYLILGSNAHMMFVDQMEQEDPQIYMITACTAKCLSTYRQKLLEHTQEQKYEALLHSNPVYLEGCHNFCKFNRTSKLQNTKKIYENFNLKLVCRDDRSLKFRVELETHRNVYRINQTQTLNSNLNNSSETTEQFKDNVTMQNPFVDTLFVVQLFTKAYVLVYVSDDSFFTLTNLSYNTSYNISVTAVHATNEYSVIAKEEQFSTLTYGFTPSKVTKIQINNFLTDKDDKLKLKAMISWKPAADMTCTYDIICFPVTGGGNDLNPLEIRNPRQLYTYTLENLHFSMEYSLGIRAKNPNTISRESELFWSNFVVPSCVEWYNYDFNICAPLAPTGLDAEQIFIGENEFSVNISWNKPEYFPDYYTLRIMDIDEKGNAFTFNVSKAATYFLIPQITIYGSHYEIHLTAFTAGGKTSAYIDNPIKTIVMISDNNDLTNIISVVLASILFVVIMGLTIFLIYYRKAKLKRHQERSKYFEELERKTPITDKSVTDYPKNTLFTVATKESANFQPHFDDVTIFNDDMEIDRHDVELLEILGEGAFGFVRRGIYKDKNSGPREVAVKMLKDQPLVEDMRAFRREIEVMKSVDKHPNIVGIIGHCTKCQNGMMLLTEYCSFGNLLDFLRDEWKHLHDTQMRTISELSKGRYEGLSKESGDNTNLNYFNNNENSENFNTNATKMQEYNSKGIKSISNNNNNDVNYNNRIEDIIKASILTPAVSNVGYGYDQMCTSTCKCEVIITDTGAQINDNEIDPIKDTQVQIGSSDVDIERYFNSGPANKTIAIKNCECEKHKMAKKIKMVENKAYFEQMLKNGNNQKEHTKLDGKVDALQFSVHREPLSVGDLADIAKQVALGMEFLSMNKVVHRDLAARNVLVTPDRTVKIADFGLSRDVYRENIYQKTGNGKLPIKWMALESLTHQIYTTQSDVWSYGILLYEIVTLGGSPYPAIPTNRLVQYLKSGHRMDKPIHCEQQLYDLMLTCWNANPADRPTFTEILQKLDKFLVKELTDKTEYTTNVTTLNLIDKVKPCLDDSYLKPLV